MEGTTVAWARREAQRTRRQYLRHFAGQARNTRDLSLLDAMVQTQERVLGAFAADAGGAEFLEGARKEFELYKTERENVRAARAEGDMDTRAQRTALLANGLFAVYRAHFAGHSRVSRSQALLSRITLALQALRDEMKALEALGVDTDRHRQNIGIVETRLAAWRAEAVAVAKAQQGATVDGRVGGLGAAANAVFDAWRTSAEPLPAASRDRAQLSTWCDELIEIARQMEAYETRQPDPRNSKNLGVVTARLQEFERAWDEAVVPKVV